MKNLLKSIAVFAAFLSFAACQKEIAEPIEEVKQTHTVTFVAGNPETKTAANVDKEQGVVEYVWKDTDADADKFHVFENGVAAISITPSLNDGVMSITAEFEGTPSEAATYTGYFNSGVQVVQTASGTDYDQLSDVLIAKETAENNEGVIHFQFKRLGAVCEVNLKGLLGTNLKTVKIESLDENVFLAGSLVDGELVGDSKVITVNCNNAITNGVGTLRFISLPIENASLRFIVETTNDGETVAAKYVKQLGKPITFTRGDLKAFNVSSFSPVTTTVTFSVNKEVSDGVLTVDGEDIPFPDVENADDNNEFVGWTTTEEYSDVTAPTDLCTEAKMGAESITYYAVYASVSPAASNPDKIVKLDATSTFAAGDNIAVFAEVGSEYYGMYQETVSSSYVKYFKLNQEPVASVFDDVKRSWTLTSADDKGNWYLGDATNGYLYNPSSNDLKVVTDNNSILTISWNASESRFSIKTGSKWIDCRTDLSGDNKYRYRCNSSAGYFDIFKLLKYSGYNTFIDTRDYSTLTWSEGAAEARIGGENTFPTLTTEPAGLAVSYSSSEEGVATINSNSGAISLVGEGTTTITATFEGNAQYKPSEASYTLTVLPAASKHTVQFSINGSIDNTETKEYTSGETIAFPEAPIVEGASFRGWLTNAINGTINSAPEGLITDTENVTMGDEDVTYFAVFATEITGEEQETKSQTLQYDTWTYSGSTTDKSSYRLFHSGSYIESAAFDLSKLSKVIVYGGTFGGGSYNSLTIGDGTNTWKSVTVSGSSQTGANEYTDGTALSGNKKLRITSNSGSSSGNGTGIRISKVEIFTKTGGTTYSDYCTTFRLLQSISVSAQPTKTEYYKGESFDPAGLSITLTYSAGEPEVVTYNSETQSRFSFDYDFAEAGQKTVTITYASKTTTCNVTVETIANTKETAYTVAQAKALIDAGKDLSTEVYVKGIVSQVDSYSDTYKSITYWISADGTTTDQFEVYSGKGLNGDDFTSIADVEIKAEVIVYGTITLYEKTTTYEFSTGSQLVYYKPIDKPIADFVKISEVDTEVNKELDITDYLNIPDNYTGGTISVSVKTGESDNVTISGTKVTFTAGGDYTLTATASAVDGICAETSGDIAFSVKNATLQNVSFGGSLTKTTYTVGDNFDWSGITLMANYSDETSVDVTDQAEWTITPTTLSTAGNVSVNVSASFGGKSTNSDYNITVNKKASSISIENISIEVGGEKTITPSSLTPSDASLTYSIVEGDAFISLDGNKITGTSEGTATVRASFVGNAEYAPASVDFTIEVSAASATKTATLTKDEITSKFTNDKMAYATEETYEDGDITWKAKAYADANNRPWMQLKKDSGVYIKISAPSPIKEVRLTITSANNSSGGVADISKHTAFSGTVRLKSSDSAGDGNTNDICSTSSISNNSATLTVNSPTNSDVYIKVSSGARIWGIEVDY